MGSIDVELEGLDAKDRRLLYELDMGARQSYSMLSHKVGLSKQSIEYRIRSLIDHGIIRGFYAALDVSKLGYLYCRVFVQFYGISPPKELEIINYLTSMKEVGWVVSADGQWDLNFVVWAKSVQELSDVLDRISYKYGALIKRKVVSIAVKIHHFQLKFLYPEAENNIVVVMQSGVGAEELDEIDFKILSLIAIDARMSLISMAGKLNMSYKVVAYRLRRLEKRGIILCYRADINFNAVKYTHYKVFLTLHNNSPEQEVRLLEFLRIHPNVIYVTKALGISDLEFECIMPNSLEFYNLIRELRSKFFYIIQDHATVMFSETHQINYLPVESKALVR